MKIFKFEKFINESDMSDLISRATKIETEMKKRKRINSKIKLGDHVVIGKYDKNRITGKWTYYRCVGINPSVVLVEENSEKTRILTDEEYSKAYQRDLGLWTDPEYTGKNSPYWTIEE